MHTPDCAQVANVDVKICGVCRAEDAKLAAEAGAAYVGVILSPGFPRSRTIAEARHIFSATAAQRVGVFVDAAPDAIAAAVESLWLDVVQLHGRETPDEAERTRSTHGVEVWKSVTPAAAAEAGDAAAAYSGAIDALLLDAAKAGASARLDWATLASVRSLLPAAMRLVLAGGLNPDNVALASSRVRPDVVDVSSGVEERLCEKSPARLRAFIAAARNAVVESTRS